MGSRDFLEFWQWIHWINATARVERYIIIPFWLLFLSIYAKSIYPPCQLHYPFNIAVTLPFFLHIAILFLCYCAFWVRFNPTLFESHREKFFLFHNWINLLIFNEYFLWDNFFSHERGQDRGKKMLHGMSLELRYFDRCNLIQYASIIMRAQRFAKCHIGVGRRRESLKLNYMRHN